MQQETWIDCGAKGGFPVDEPLSDQDGERAFKGDHPVVTT